MLIGSCDTRNPGSFDVTAGASSRGGLQSMLITRAVHRGGLHGDHGLAVVRDRIGKLGDMQDVRSA
jgi:hypothetical protein